MTHTHTHTHTVCELFAGVGGFRLGLNHKMQPEIWTTVFFNQWEPDDSKQSAYHIYIDRFHLTDVSEASAKDITLVDKNILPDFNLLVGGFPCQDYSIANHNGRDGINGKKGVLWWQVHETVKCKRPMFILLENVDMLLKSNKGKDFITILESLVSLDYTVEWRMINSADYGCVQRRKRVYIFACRNDTKFAKSGDLFFKDLFECVSSESECVYESYELDEYDLGNYGRACKDKVVTQNVTPILSEMTPFVTILHDEPVDEKWFIPQDKLYYTDPEVTSSDETCRRLPVESRRTFQYTKGGKKIKRVSPDGHEYFYSEGAMSLVDDINKPARTCYCSQGITGRSAYVVPDKTTGRLRVITPIETERLNGFPDDWTKEYTIDDHVFEVPDGRRRFLMGNALVIQVIERMSDKLYKMINKEFDWIK